MLTMLMMSPAEADQVFGVIPSPVTPVPHMMRLKVAPRGSPGVALSYDSTYLDGFLKKEMGTLAKRLARNIGMSTETKGDPETRIINVTVHIK